MFITRIIYCSELSGVDKEAISAILDVSRKKNAKAGITGLLLFNGTYFLQCLEGSRAAVNETYHRIVRDERHRNPVLLTCEELPQRDFADWDMAFVPWTAEIRSIVRCFSTCDEFDPYCLGAQSAIGLFRAIKDRLPTSDYWVKPLQSE